VPIAPIGPSIATIAIAQDQRTRSFKGASKRRMADTMKATAGMLNFRGRSGRARRSGK